MGEVIIELEPDLHSVGPREKLPTWIIESRVFASTVTWWALLCCLHCTDATPIDWAPPHRTEQSKTIIRTIGRNRWKWYVMIELDRLWGRDAALVICQWCWKGWCDLHGKETILLISYRTVLEAPNNIMCGILRRKSVVSGNKKLICGYIAQVQA